MRKLGRLIVLCLAVGICLSLLVFATGCGGGDSESNSDRTPIEEEPGKVVVESYPENDNPELWPQYAAEYDRPVINLTGGQDEALAKVRAGYKPDVVDICVETLQPWVDLGLIEPWDTDLISNYGDLNQALVEPGQVDGKQYLMPIGYATYGILYNKDVVDVPPAEQSWALMWDPKYAGKISWDDDPRLLAEVASVLGFEEPWNMTDEQLAEVKKVLLDAKPLVRNFSTSSADLASDLVAGNIVLANATSDTWLKAKLAGANIGFMTPKEGKNVSVCGLVLMKDAENYYHAHKLVDAWMSKEAAQYQMNTVGFSHSNSNADLSGLSQDQLEAFGLDDPKALVPPRGIPTPYIPRLDVYSKTWAEIVQS